MKKIVYGIDFGTTNTAVAMLSGLNQPKILPIDKTAPNPNILRSVIYVTKNGEHLFGENAIQKYNYEVATQKAAHREFIHTGNYIKVTSDATSKSGYVPDKIVEEVYESEVSDVGKLLQGIKSFLGNTLFTQITIFDKQYLIEELIALFLSEVRNRANEYTGQNVTSAVIGRPVNFVGNNNEIAVQRLLKASKLAGFTDVKLEFEPIGAALDYGITAHNNQKSLIFDFGGGTLDLSIVQFPNQEVITTTGIPLGGDLINSRVFMEKISPYFGKNSKYGFKQLGLPQHIFNKLQHWYSISLLKTKDFENSLEKFKYQSSNLESIENLHSLVFKNLGFGVYEEIDRVKKYLSAQEIDAFSFLVEKTKIQEKISRDEFETIMKKDLQNIDTLIQDTLDAAKIKKNEIESVVLTGGSSLIPSVQDILVSYFGKEKITTKETFTSVASGLALSST